MLSGVESGIHCPRLTCSGMLWCFVPFSYYSEIQSTSLSVFNCSLLDVKMIQYQASRVDQSIMCAQAQVYLASTRLLQSMLGRLPYTLGGDIRRAMALWGTLYPTESGVTSFEREIFLLKRYFC
jgi:hypothetical protein